MACNNNRTEFIKTRVTPQEKAKITQVAKKANMSPSEYMRECLLSKNSSDQLAERKPRYQFVTKMSQYVIELQTELSAEYKSSPTLNEMKQEVKKEWLSLKQ